MDVTINISRTNLLEEKSGLKAHRALVPASARYAKRHLIWGGKVSLDQFRIIRTRVIAAKVGQKILFSGRGAIMLCSLPATDAPAPGPVRGSLSAYLSSGDAISTKTHAKTGTVAHISNIEAEDPRRL
jgi:hypothetical protein